MYRAEEDYIKTIYELTEEKRQELIRVPELASSMGLSGQTVNEMVKKLVAKKLLVFMPYKGVRLTKKGFSEAVRMIRAHRIWEVFLTDKLGFNWGSVHQEAERLEHATSETVLSKLDAYLGYPTHCGHGNPIPAKDGSVQKPSNMTLFQLKEGAEFVIVRVLDNRGLLLYLDRHNIKINQHYRVVEKDVFGGIIKIQGELSHILSRQTAEMIFVESI